MKKNYGITLIALIITIIILIILAGVSINLVFGENSIINKAKKSEEMYNIAKIKEELDIEIANIFSKKLENIKREDLLELENIGATLNNLDIPTRGTYKGYFFEIDENYEVTIFDSEGEIFTNKPVIGVKELTKTGYTLYVKNNYFEKNVTFNYYLNNKLVAENVKDTNFVVSGLENGKNAYVVANIEGEKYKSDYLYIDAISDGPILTQNDENIIVSGFNDKLSSIWGTSNYYHAFDGNDSTYTSTINFGGSEIGSFIGYDFKVPVYVLNVSGKIRMLSYKIQYSDNLTEWNDAIIQSSQASDNGNIFNNKIPENIGAHRYWRLYVNGTGGNPNWSAIVYSLNFSILKEDISIYTLSTEPILTQNDENIIQNGFLDQYTSIWGTNNHYYAFDNNDITWTGTPSSINIGSYMGYDFKYPVKIAKVSGKIRMLSYKIQYSDNLQEWNDATTIQSSKGSESGDIFDNVEIPENIGAHRYWRLYVNGVGSTNPDWSAALIYDLKFFVQKSKQIITV